MKQNIAFLLAIALLFGLAGCASSKPAPETAPTASAAAATPLSENSTTNAASASGASELDGTCWYWGIGASDAAAYWVQFHGDGTMETLNVNYDSPDDVVSVPYSYENGVLTISPSSVYPETSTYQRMEDGSFRSDIHIENQAGLGWISFRPDESQKFTQVQKLDSLYRDVLMKGVWFHPNMMDLGASRTVFREGYRAEHYDVSFEQDENFEHVISYSYVPTHTTDVVFRFFDGTIDNMTYDPERDVLYYTWYNDISDDTMVEYLIHYDSDPDVDTFMRDFLYYTSLEMSIRPKN